MDVVTENGVRKCEKLIPMNPRRRARGSRREREKFKKRK